ncbi:MAG: hypothetical protein ACR2LH_03255 [Thermoleophilaceae bacterium]
MDSARALTAKRAAPAKLYNEAKQLNVDGRSHMNKQQLQRAVDAKKS